MKRRILWLGACLALAALWAAGLPAGPALAAMVLLPPLSWCLTLPAAGKLETTLRLPATADKGGEIPLTVQVCNPTRLPIGPVRCRIALGNELTGETATVENDAICAHRRLPRQRKIWRDFSFSKNRTDVPLIIIDMTINSEYNQDETKTRTSVRISRIRKRVARPA